VVRSLFILVFFDSGASYYLISGSSSASRSIFICIDASRGNQKAKISTESRIVITCVIRQVVSLLEECQYAMTFQN